MMNLAKTKVARENYTVGTISEMFERGMLREDHPSQRRAGQHANDWRDGFVVTVIKNEDFDPIKICEQIFEGFVTNWLIDGVQRLTNIKSYKHNAFKLGRNIETPIVTYQIAKKDDEGHFLVDENGNPAYETVEFDLRGKYFKDLPRELQIQFDRCPIDVVKHLDCTDSEVSYHIRRYNHQKSMNGTQIGVTYSEKRGAEIKAISLENKFFVDCGKYTATETKNGIIERIVMESVVAALHTDNWKKQTNKMGAYINENVSKEDFHLLNDYFTRLIPFCEGKYQNIFNSKNTFIFIAAFDRFTKFGLEDGKFAEFLDAFEDNLHSKVIDGVTYDGLDSNRATKDKTVVTGKIEFLEKLMMDYFSINKEELEIKSDEEFIADMTEMDVEEVSELMDLCNETLDDLLTGTIVDGNKLLDEENRQSLLALVMYGLNAIKQTTLESWFKEYIAENPNYIRNQKQNYLHMRNDLNKFCAVG